LRTAEFHGKKMHRTDVTRAWENRDETHFQRSRGNKSEDEGD